MVAAQSMWPDVSAVPIWTWRIPGESSVDMRSLERLGSDTTKECNSNRIGGAANQRAGKGAGGTAAEDYVLLAGT